MPTRRPPTQANKTDASADVEAKPSAITLTRRPRMTAAEQSAEFERVAREHGASDDEDAFKGVLRKLAKPQK